MVSDVFVAVAHPVDKGEPVVEIGSALSYGGASDLVREWAKDLRNVKNILWIGVERRCSRV